MTTKPTATQIAKLKAKAKCLARTGTFTHSEALDTLARGEGFLSWHDLDQAHKSGSQSDVTAGTDLPVDPELPPEFFCTPNEERSTAELDLWWDRPFATTERNGQLTVCCLDGGAWDRPTFYGQAPDLVSAAKLASEKLRAWKRMRSQPVATMVENGFAPAQMPQRPGDDMKLLAEPMSADSCAAWVQNWTRSRSA